MRKIFRGELEENGRTGLFALGFIKECLDPLLFEGTNLVGPDPDFFAVFGVADSHRVFANFERFDGSLAGRNTEDFGLRLLWVIPVSDLEDDHDV